MDRDRAGITAYDKGEITSKELLGQMFSYLHSHREEIDAALDILQQHPDQAIRDVGGKLLTLLA